MMVLEPIQRLTADQRSEEISEIKEDIGVDRKENVEKELPVFGQAKNWLEKIEKGYKDIFFVPKKSTAP